MGFSRQEYWSGVPLPSPTDIYYLALYRKSPNSCSSLYQNIYFPEQYALVQETQVGRKRKTENKTNKYVERKGEKEKKEIIDMQS